MPIRKPRISDAELRTLALLAKAPAVRVHKSARQGDYTWRHEDADKPITTPLHTLFVKGYATVADNDNDTAQITERGLEIHRQMHVRRRPTRTERNAALALA
jgi:hypothetical protein